jgi:hypothetical protein
VVEVYHSITGEFQQHRINEPADVRFPHAMLISTPNLVRVAALTHEGILELGWKPMKEYDSTIRYILSHNELEWFKPYTGRYGELYIWRDIEGAELFHIRTPLEFRDLMRFLGIKIK